ncbi:helix-turn-helix domain-containing protein, partial [Candidatus Roizmanbacteria bacterium]|nr:helix-turn-helix domain-containing protein [Candidatus Roizmanbacteria bacterium]
MAKSKEKIEARILRREGKSIKEIAKKLHVSPGSISVWCRDIELSKNQILTLQKRMLDINYGNRSKYLKRIKEETNKKIIHLNSEGVKEINKLSKREIFLVGVALYWAEGFKKDHQVGFATSDSKMAKFFIHWLELSFKITHKDLILRVTANISYKNKIKNLEKYWSEKLNIPLQQFSKPFYQKTKWRK